MPSSPVHLDSNLASHCQVKVPPKGDYSDLRVGRSGHSLVDLQLPIA
jgi:hypothetical protein